MTPVDSPSRKYGVERLVAHDASSVARAKSLFSMMSKVFETEQHELDEAYVAGLLAREEFWALAATSGDELVGGLTAHALPMTRSMTRELFIYDLAVREDHQRRGVGRLLMAALQRLGAEAGIAVSFVPADDEDEHALEFYRAVGGVGAPVTIFTFGSET